MKIKLPNPSGKKHYFPISFDSSTSLNFGECIPTFCREIPQNSHVTVDLRSACRFAPMVLPTFGRASLHTYAYYHKIQDLWPPFNDFLARTPYTTSVGSQYVPSQVPSLPLSFFWFLTLAHSSFTVYKLDSSSVFFSNSPVTSGHYSVSDYVIDNVSGVSAGFVYTLAQYISSFTGNNLYMNYLRSTSRRNFLVYPLPSSEIGEVYNTTPSTCIPSSDSSAIVPAGCDYMFKISGDQLSLFNLTPPGSFTSVGSSSDSLLVCVKLNYSGKLLRKIFMGLGYHIKCSPVVVSALKLYAFYKSYFETFAPKRFIKFDQTSFYKAINFCVQYGQSLSNVLFSGSVSGGYTVFCYEILKDLLSCYYTQNTDYYSSQILGLTNQEGVTASYVTQSYLAVDGSGNSKVDELPSNLSTPGSVPNIDFGNSALTHTQSQQNILSRLTQFVNTRSLLGGKINDLLYSVFGIKKSETYEDDRAYFGSSVVDVEFNDVFSTAETSEASLGEYAGKAIGLGRSDKHSIQCDSPGFILAFCCVIPRTQYVQGLDPCLLHIKAEHFYNPKFDGLTLLPTSRLTFNCVDSVNEPVVTDNTASFGNQSLYAEYKMTSQGILNGDLSLMSTKSSFDGFTLDRVFADYVTQNLSEDGSISFNVISPDTSGFVAGTMWRYLGRWLWLGNFDRIFVNTRQSFTLPLSTDFNPSFINKSLVDDNIIVHNVVDIAINSPMLPLADSFMTRDLNELGSDAPETQAQ